MPCTSTPGGPGSSSRRGQLEYLCDIAAAEFLMPLDLFCQDLVDKGFGAGCVDALCSRYGASMEAVCLRMVESNLENCALVLLEHRRQRPQRQRQDLELPPDATPPVEKNIRVVYSAPSRRFCESRSCSSLRTWPWSGAAASTRRPAARSWSRDRNVWIWAGGNRSFFISRPWL